MRRANILQQLRDQAQFLLDRGAITRGQRLVVAGLMRDAADLVDRLDDECDAWMNGVADVVEPLGYDRHAACGPSDLLPGLTDLRKHGMECARRLAECVEARSYLYEQVVEMSSRLDEAKRIAEPDPEPNPFSEHTRMWEDEIRGMGDDSRDPRGLPPFNPETLAEVQRWYESNGREKR